MYLKIEGPESLRFEDGHQVSSSEEYLGWHAVRVQTRGIATRSFSSEMVVARINHGRWCADCLFCGQAMFTRPDWNLACCAECGWVYADVVFPINHAVIVALLVVRPKRENQNWEPGEPLWRLRAENLFYGVRT